jgi:Domain of unknown function (DUF5753)/Helix-turn-helix domain
VPGIKSPTVRRRRLASELRRLREAAKLTCEDVAERLECSASKISRIETGRVAVSPRDVRDLRYSNSRLNCGRRALIELSATPNMFLQVIPFGGGAHVAMDTPFVILAYPDRADPDVVCIGYATGMLWVEDISEVGTYNMIFHHLQAAALSFDESVALMISVLKER